MTSSKFRRLHGRDGLDVIQDHVRISAERVHRARLQASVPRRPKAHVEEPEQVAALGQFLEAKMKVSQKPQAEAVTVSTPRRQRQRNGSDNSFGLEFKLSRITKQHKRRSGIRILKPATEPRSKLQSPAKSRHGIAVQTVASQHRENSGNPLGLQDDVLSAFRAVAHVWLSRKRRKDRAMRENVTNKLVLHQSRPKELSPAVFEIISKSFVSTIPALQFFDTGEPDAPPIREVPSRPAQPAPPSLTPRGICYTIDSSGHRQSKMQHSVDHVLPDDHKARDQGSSRYATSMEEAVMHTLNKRYDSKRLKLRMAAKKQRIADISEAFATNQDHLKLNLSAKLAMHWAEREHLHSSKLETACLNDTNLPSFQIDKDQHLERLRAHKSRLLELCQTLSVFGALLRAHHEMREDLTRSELHVLALFRIVVENNCVLTPVVVQGIVSQLSATDVACSHVQVAGITASE
ncbi:hypothetical protein ACHHYP_04378 [Achlya hypogyna]|uniref:Uncharacterized protein n=1 Tax=Achlya hypogyna TaxID=1202772 RepID=A0A1V9Z188_ACHHY|nr:hypothetical protein ACHHYP_04378 [Achlya hypogyna]